MQTTKTMRPKEVAATLNISLSTLWRWCEKKRLPEPIRLSSRVIVWREDDIEKLLKPE